MKIWVIDQAWGQYGCEMAKLFLGLFSCKMCQSCPLGISRFGPRKSYLFGNIINPLLAKLVCSRWLNIVFSLFFTLLLTSTSCKSMKKKTHTQKWNSNLANIELSWSNICIFIYFSRNRRQKGKFWHQEEYNRHKNLRIRKWPGNEVYHLILLDEKSIWLSLVKVEIRT